MNGMKKDEYLLNENESMESFDIYVDKYAFVNGIIN
jgi:hypothetical protein